MLPGEDASSKAEEAATRRALLDRGSGVPMALDRQHVFLDAAKAREWATVRHTLEGTPELINVQPAGRWSALHQAAEAGDEATIQHLLGLGASTTALTRDARRPIDVAANEKCRELLQAREPVDFAQRIAGDFTPGLFHRVRATLQRDELDRVNAKQLGSIAGETVSVAVQRLDGELAAPVFLFPLSGEHATVGHLVERMRSCAPAILHHGAIDGGQQAGGFAFHTIELRGMAGRVRTLRIEGGGGVYGVYDREAEAEPTGQVLWHESEVDSPETRLQDALSLANGERLLVRPQAKVTYTRSVNIKAALMDGGRRVPFVDGRPYRNLHFQNARGDVSQIYCAGTVESDSQRSTTFGYNFENFLPLPAERALVESHASDDMHECREYATDSTDFNLPLLLGDLDEAHGGKEKLERMCSAIRKQVVHNLPSFVFRMMDLSEHECARLETPGHVFRTNTFWSTSRKILHDNAAFAKNTLFVLFLPAGRRDNVADIASVSPYGEDEAELLLNPFQMFRIEGSFALRTVPHVFVLTFLDYKFHTDSGMPKPRGET